MRQTFTGEVLGWRGPAPLKVAVRRAEQVDEGDVVDLTVTVEDSQ